MSKEHTKSLFEALARCQRADLQGFADAWVGMEPTFSNAKAVKKWAKLAAKGHAGEDAYFEDPWMLKKLRDVGREFKKRYKAGLARKDPACVFPELKLEMDRDPWNVQRLNCVLPVSVCSGEILHRNATVVIAVEVRRAVASRSA